MNYRAIFSLTSKDFFLYFQNRLFAVVTVVGLLAYLAVYFLLPAGVDQTLEIGFHAPAQLSSVEGAREEGLEFRSFDSEENLRKAVEEGDYVAGIAFPEDLVSSVSAGDRPTITLYFPPDVPDSTKSALRSTVQNWGYSATGKSVTVEFSEEILGRELVTGPIPARDRLRPLFAVFLIMTETMGLASLITEEIETKTLKALLVSPLNTAEIFLAKGITGVGLASIQAVFFMALVGGLSRSPMIVLVSLILGSAMLTGISFLIASVSSDTVSVMAWGILALIVMMIPAGGVLFPGASANWMRFIPSYYLMDSVHIAANFGAGWSDVWTHLIALTLSGLIIGGAGVKVLERRFR